jgi:hypothetical protein
MLPVRVPAYYLIAGCIALCLVVSIIATVMLPDHTGRDISQEHA